MLCPDLDFHFDRFQGSIFQKVHPFCLSVADLSPIKSHIGIFFGLMRNLENPASPQLLGQQRKMPRKCSWRISGVSTPF